MHYLALYAIWTAYFGAFVVNHLRVRRQRRDTPRERRVARDRSSDAGMALQFAGVLLTFIVRRSDGAAQWITTLGLALAGASMLFTWWGLGNLGRQWRLQAVVTDDHELITSGPYAWVRHPVYTAFFGMVVANGMVLSTWWAGVLAAVFHVAGTEIRIRAEDRILTAHFSERFTEYRARVSAWLPPIR